jgi:DMSO/TMAO reductase YedYZ molybdopterin-dependent catalytic subunit
MDKKSRIVTARMKLRERFQTKTRSTSSLSETDPEGTGPLNRHGMPSLPPGQTLTPKWPVLDLGFQPAIDTQKWSLTVDGAVSRAVCINWDDLMALDHVEDTSDFHCVTTWSRLNLNWVGVQLSTVLAMAYPAPDATHVLCHGYDGYTTNLALEECLKDDVLLAHQVDGEPLPNEHGGPVRVVTPQLYAWKGAKWIRRLEVRTKDVKGFWEQRGYSNTAYPWRNDRYS